MQKFLGLFIALASIILMVAFTNCGEQLQLPSTQPPSASQVNLGDPFAGNKMQFNLEAASESANAALVASKMGLKTKSGGTLIPAQTKLIVVVYNSCENPTPLLAKIISNQPQLNLEVQNYIWTLSEDAELESLRDLIQQDPCIRGVTNDALLSAEAINDPLYAQSTGLQALGHPKAHKFMELPGIGAATTVSIAVIDSGVDYTHPDLANVIARDSANRIIGYDFRNNDADPMDDFGHGTAVSGLIAASGNNGLGSRGVLGKNARIIPLKVQDRTGVGLISDIVRAIDYAISVKADVLNISMAGETSSASLLDSLQRAAAANIFVALAAGNANVEISPSKVIVPAFYGASISGVMTVGSIDSGTASRSSFSNYSATYVEIFAPGKNGIIYPCWPGAANCANGSGYASGQGTSYSSPFVAGAAAWAISNLKTQGVGYNAAQIEGLLIRTSQLESGLTLVGREGRSLNLERLSHYLKTSYSQSTSGGYDDF